MFQTQKRCLGRHLGLGLGFRVRVRVSRSRRDGLATVQTEKLVNVSPCWTEEATVTDISLRANLRVGKVRDVHTHFVGAFF